jgi:hypothetical protein
MKAYYINSWLIIIIFTIRISFKKKQELTVFVELLSIVQKLLKQYRNTQNLALQTDWCGINFKLNVEQLLGLAEFIEANNAATLQ